MIYKNILEYAERTCDLEEKREQSLISQSNQMLTAFSITTAVLLAIYKIAHDGDIVPFAFLNTVTIICIFLFIASMVLALLVSWRYRYVSLPSPNDMMDHILKNKDYFETLEQRDKSLTQTLNKVWESKNKLNNKRAKLISASMILYFIALLIATLSVVVFLLALVLRGIL